MLYEILAPQGKPIFFFGGMIYDDLYILPIY
jgi:hypothetical protein